MAYKKEITDVFGDDFEVTYEEEPNAFYNTSAYAKDRYKGTYDEEYEDYEEDYVDEDLGHGYDYEDEDYRQSYDYDEEDDFADDDYRSSRRGSSRKKSRGVPLAAPIRKGGRALSRATAALVRFLTAALILATTVYVTYTFWRASTPYGDIMESIRARDISMTLAAYLSIAAIFILFEFIALLWSMTRTRVRDGLGTWKEDTGRGLISFVLVFATSYASFLIYRFLPETPEILYGLKGALDVYGSMHNVLLGLCAAGVISCLVRKYF